VETRFIEAMHPGGKGNWGKFMLGRFTPEEWACRSNVHGALLSGRGWNEGHILVLDLQTGEGAVFRHGGLASADLKKHAIWVCPLFPHFLEWLYEQDVTDLSKLPGVVEIPHAEFSLVGRRHGEAVDPRRALEQVLEIVDHTRGFYPERAFPPAGKTPDAQAAAGCRLACDSIRRDVLELMKTVEHPQEQEHA
jgi:hypothetical protein